MGYADRGRVRRAGGPILRAHPDKSGRVRYTTAEGVRGPMACHEPGEQRW